MSGNNPIKVRPDYTDRTCLGPMCRGQKTFRSAGAQNRICKHCKALIAGADATWVAHEAPNPSKTDYTE